MITSSTKCAREPAIQSSALAEWCTAWNRHRNGTVCTSRCAAYSARSATRTANANWTSHGNPPTHRCNAGLARNRLASVAGSRIISERICTGRCVDRK